jgi:hypothetical protein
MVWVIGVSEEAVDFNSWCCWTRQLKLPIQSDIGNFLTSRATISFSSNLLREIRLSPKAKGKTYAEGFYKYS